MTMLFMFTVENINVNNFWVEVYETKLDNDERMFW